jgi:GNAT superfamily N-acetyltransferase
LPASINTAATQRTSSIHVRQSSGHTARAASDGQKLPSGARASASWRRLLHNAARMDARSPSAADLIAVTTWYLETRDAAELRPAQAPATPLSVVEVQRPSPAFSRYLYTAVGGDWQWTDRLPWTEAEWRAYLDPARVRTWVLWQAGAPAGYVELQRQERDIEIAYFGLMPDCLGRGWGGHLLTEGLRAAWAWGADRVWVHTCSLDGPAALANYEARGLRRYHQTVTEKRLAPAIGHWPGSRP